MEATDSINTTDIVKVSDRPALYRLLTLSGSALIKRILDEDRPDVFVKNLPAEDFFWIVKRIGDEDCLPVLELAHEDQWQFLLDLEIWSKDALDSKRTLAWLNRLGGADPERLASWLFEEGEDLLSLLLLRTAEVVAKDGDDEAQLNESYVTEDGEFFYRALDPDDQEHLENLLRALARKDHERYRALLHGLAGVIAPETENELYHFRNSRIAEHGFVPFEEALAVFSPLEPSELQSATPVSLPGKLLDPEEKDFIPLLPMLQIGEGGFLNSVLREIKDPLLSDRIRLESADLTNRIIAAEAFDEINPERISESCRKAAGYLNIALEGVCGKDLRAAERLLRNNALLQVFRVGYGFVMNIQRETKRWRRGSWFFNRGWENDFWGDPWGEVLDGILAARPRCRADGKSTGMFREFESLEDLEDVREKLRTVRVLDGLLARLSRNRTAKESLLEVRTFHPLLFNRWARRLLGMEISSAPLTVEEARTFFRTLRRGETGKPFRMAQFRDVFISDFTDGAADVEPSETEILKKALVLVWDAFRAEYESIEESDLDGRFSAYLLIA